VLPGPRGVPAAASPSPGEDRSRPGRGKDAPLSGRQLDQPDDSFTSLGLDSLDRLAHAVAIEQAAGVVVTDQVLAGAASPAGVARRLLASLTGALP
jgi:acyl carrier protein